MVPAMLNVRPAKGPPTIVLLATPFPYSGTFLIATVFNFVPIFIMKPFPPAHCVAHLIETATTVLTAPSVKSAILAL